MNCLILDDEPLAIRLLESYIDRVDGLELIKSCSNAMDALTIIRNRKIDLLFLDIQMPKITGIDLLRSLHKRPSVIFTTAYRDYAVEAFDLDVIDYLVKPISFERFLRAVSKVLQTRQSDPDETSGYSVLHSFEQAYIYFKEDKEMIKVFLKDILFIESLRDYVRVKTTTRQIITYKKISYLEQKLPEHKFARIHRSFIVALEKVKSFTATSVNLENQKLPLGRNYKKQAIHALNKLNILYQDD
jgi:DNA-binding LytR/AlgR family response regulator